MVKNDIRESFFLLVRLGIGHCADALPQAVDWRAIQALANQQGLYAIVLDGIGCLPQSQRPPQTMLLEWIGEVLQSYECRYGQYRETIAEMAAFYNSHGIKMMVLKGLACSLNWPKPEHRPCGDIDIWQFGDYKKADELVIKEKSIKVDKSHHHHTVFCWGGWTVENHYDFINIHHHKSNVGLDRTFKELATDDKFVAKVNGEDIILPSPNLHAFFLLRHAMNHFASSEITLRQLLDWAFHVDVHGKEIDWGWLNGELEKYGMKELYNCFNAICVEDLGFDANIFHTVQFNPALKERVLNEILAPGFSGVEPSNLIKRIEFKYRRWKANGWKHSLCYNESMISAFCSGVWSHILKPSSI